MNFNLPPLSERLNFRNQSHLCTSTLESIKSDQAAFAVELRKKKRRVLSNIKRCLGTESIKLIYESSSLKTFISNFTDTESFILSVLDLLSQGIPSTTHECFKVLDKIVKSTDLANMILQSSYLQIIVKYLFVEDSELLTVITSLFTNLACAEKNSLKILIETQAIQRLLHLSNTFQGTVQRNSLWALCNICSEMAKVRKYLIDLGVDKEIIQQILTGKQTLDKHFELLSQFCKEILTEESYLNCIKISYLILIRFTSEYSVEIRISALWILFHLTYYNPTLMDTVLDYRELLPEIVNIVISEAHLILIKAASFNISNLSGYNASYTQRLLENNVLEAVNKLIHIEHTNLRKEGYFILSNLAAGVAEQVKIVFQYKNLIVEAFEGVYDSQAEVRENAWHVFYNICRLKSKDFIMKLVKNGLLEAVSKGLRMESDPKCIKKALGFIEYLILAGELEGTNVLVSELNEYSIFEWVSEYSYHKDLTINEISNRIIDSHYSFNA